MMAILTENMLVQHSELKKVSKSVLLMAQSMDCLMGIEMEPLMELEKGILMGHCWVPWKDYL